MEMSVQFHAPGALSGEKESQICSGSLDRSFGPQNRSETVAKKKSLPSSCRESKHCLPARSPIAILTGSH
jgi:hypothetical protein